VSALFEHALHEGRHVVSGWFCGLDVQRAAVGTRCNDEGLVHIAPSENGAADLLTRLVGWMSDPDLPPGAVWPPPYPPPVDHDPEGVGWCVRRYGLSREAYASVCELAADLVQDDEFRRAVRLVGRALVAAPLIDAAGLQILREAAGFADEPEVAA
jgi:hypothetical protein